MRKPIIAANWKMHKTLAEAEQFMLDIKGKLPKAAEVTTVICASSLFLPSLVSLKNDNDLSIGAQTMHFEKSGAFTGEVSPVALADLGVTHVILGHSERRALFNETDEDVNKKVHAAFAHNLVPIVCVGESLEAREANETKAIVVDQVKAALVRVEEDEVKQLVIAYEPIWAIGTGKSSSAKDANEVCRYIRESLAQLYSEETAATVRIQYGGSVNPENISEYMAETHIDGALVGGASLEADSFVRLLEAATNE